MYVRSKCISIADFGLLFDLHNASEDKGRTENLQKKSCHSDSCMSTGGQTQACLAQHMQTSMGRDVIHDHSLTENKMFIFICSCVNNSIKCLGNMYDSFTLCWISLFLQCLIL